MLVAASAQHAQELRLGHDEAALALHGLEDDGRHLLGGDTRAEGLVEAVEIVEGNAVDLGREGA